MASKDNSEGPFTDGAYSYPMEGLRSLVRIVSPETLWDRRYSPAVLEDGQGCTESASMGQSPSVAGFVQQAHQVVQQKPVETAPLKRRKKEPGAPTKKSVVVLKGSDVTTRDGLVFMPNAIEMANLKKTGKGQFKKMEMSSKMSETEIGQTLTALFPNLQNKRFYCASAADNRTRLDFHGEPRIWNGRFMKQTIKGNSALYVFVDEPQVTSVEETPMEVDQNQEESATSGQQSVGNPSLQVPDGNVQARDTSCPPLPHSCQHARGMVSSTLAPHMSSLNISGAPFMQENRGESGSDYESQSTDSATDRPTDSGIEASDVFCVSDGPTETLPEPVLRGSSVLDMLPNDPCSGAVSEGQQDLPSGVPPPPSSQMTDSGVPNAAIEENSFDGESDDLTALLGVVQGIYPLSGSLEGGVPFQVTVKEELPDEVNQGTAEFQGVATVPIFKENPFIFQGIVPRSVMPGIVPVIIKTDAEKRLGITSFEYIDEMRNMVRQLVHNPKLQGKLFAMWSEELGFLPTGANATHALKQLKEVSDEDSSDQIEDRISVKLLQQMVYTAAQSGGQQFIEIVFGTSAGQLVFNSYKDKKPLPEDVARANGHEELAEYFKDIKTSLSQDEDVQSNAIDWSELMMAIQKKTAVKRIESTIGLEQSSQDDDDDLSDYFADAESCSCESSDCDTDGSDIVEKSDSKEYWVIEREPTQEQIAIEHVPAVNKSVAFNKGEERESCKVQTPQRLGNSTGLRGVPTVEGTGKEIYLGQIMVQLADFWTSAQEANITRVVTFFFKAQKGGFEFRISLKEALPDEVKSGHAWFDKVAIVPVHKLDPLTLYGTVPRSQVTGDVVVGVRTDCFRELGITLFKYIDDGENTLKQFIQDPALQARYFTMVAGNLANGIPTSGGHLTQALGPINVLQNGSSIQAKQGQSVELLQLMVHTAAETGAQRFIEMVFSTSAGQVVFCSYKDRNPLLEDVARAIGHGELAQYLQDVHTRLSLDKNVHSTVSDWLELVEAVQKQSLTTQDESPVGLDQSDEDDDDSSDYFADAETSSCGSCDDDPGWPEISEKEESCVHDGISSEVQITSESNDLSMKCSSKASFTKNERIIKGESTKGQTTRNDICFVVKQGSSCLDKGRETGEYSELSSSLGCVADLLEMSCEDLNNENSISKGPCIHGEISNEVQSTGECNDLSRTSSSKALFTKNERIITGESTKGQITRDEISFVVKQGSSCLDKGEEREISELSKPQRITTLPELFVMSCEDPGEDNLNFSTSRNNMAKEPKEPCIQEVTSNEVRPVEIIVSWCDDRSMTSSKASFTKNAKIVEVESTKRQTTSEDRAFAMKQGSSCLEKGKEREFSELSRPEKISCLPKLLGTSCEDLNSGDIISTESWARDGNYVETYIKSAAVIDHSPMNKFAMKTSDSNNDSILTGEELNQEPTAKPDGIAMNSKAHIKKEEEDASAAEEGVILDTEASEIKNERVTEEESSQRQSTRENIVFDVAEQSLLSSSASYKGILRFDTLKTLVEQLLGRDFSPSYRASECLCRVHFGFKDRPANERLRDAVRAISDAKTKGVWKCLASEFRVSEMTRIDLVVNKWKLRYWSIQRETLFSHLKLLMKEQHLLEREQLFAMERLLSQKLSTKTKQLLSVRLMKRLRKFQGTYEVSGDPVCKSVNSYEGEPREVALAILFELFLDPVAAQTSLESTVGVRNSKINQTDRESQQVDKNDCKALKLCKEGRGAQVTYEAVQASLHVNDVQLEDLAVGFRRVLQTKPLESNLRKTDEITVETLFDLSCDLREEWKYLAFALGVGDAKNDRVDERNQTFREKCYNMLLLWKQRFGPQATYKALEVGLSHDSVQREDLVKKYCHDIISSAMQ